MKGRISRLVVSMLVVLLSIAMAENVLLLNSGIGTVKAVPVFSDGFESGDFGAWSGTSAPAGSTVEVVSSPVYQGSYAAHLSNGAVDTVPTVWKDFTPMDTAYARVYVNFADLSFGPNPSRQTRAIFFVFGMSEYLSYRSEVSVYNDNGNYVWALKITDDGGNPYFVTSSQTVSTNTWYCVEVERAADSSLGESRLYIDGTEILNVTGIDTAVTGKSDILILGGETYGQVSLTNNYFDSAVIDNSYIGPEPTSPPVISILSPENTTYTTADVPLNFTTNEPAAWMGYSLDGQTNVTVTDNTTMTGISDGSHQAIVYANDSAGNVGSSEPVYFTVESTSQIMFDQTGIGTDYTDTVVTIDGTNYTVTDLPASLNWTVGSTHTFDFQSPLVASTSTEQYIWASTTGLSPLQNDTITVSAYGSVIGNYNTQYYLTVTSNPPETATPSGSGWYTAGTYASISTPQHVPGGSRYNFTGWTAQDMTEITDPSSPSTTVLIDKAKTVTANYVNQEQVAFAQSGVNSDFTGTIVTIDGTDYNVSSLQVSFWWDNGSIHAFSFISPLTVNASVQYNWVSTTGLTTSQSGSLTVSNSGTVTGDYAVASVSQHDVAVTDLESSKTVLGRGCCGSVNVTVVNLDDSVETFNVSVYANTTIMTSQNVTLSNGNSATLPFTWNTTGFAYGNYSISAYAWPVPGETDTADNNCTGGWVYVSIIGDVTGGTPNLLGFAPDGKVDMKDVGVVARFFNPNVPAAYSNCDLTGPTLGVPDGKIDMRDVGLVARQFGTRNL